MHRILPSVGAGLVALVVGCEAWRHSPGNGRAYDFGPVFASNADILVHVFKITNKKNKILNIQKIIRSCNCAEAQLSAMAVGPGSSADLRLTIKPSPALGSWRVSCTLETDDPDDPVQTYAVTYRSYPHVSFDTSRVELGQSTSGGAGENSPSKRVESWIELYELTSNRIDAFDTIEVPPPLSYSVDRVPIIDRLEGGRITRSRH